MRWDASGYGAHTEKATSAPALQWFFAEGAQGFFSTYVLLANPQTTANVATVDYLREGLPPVIRTYDLAPLSRRTVDAGADTALRNTSFGMVVRFEQPGVAERAMYFGESPLWKGGHESAGVTLPAPEWFLAEGATGPFFETFILLANPDPAATADVTVTYLRAAGLPPITRPRTIAPASRITINVEQEDTELANAAFGTRVSSSLRSSSSARSTGRIRRQPGTKRTTASGRPRQARNGASPKAVSAVPATIKPTSCWRTRRLPTRR
jgi:hypothetical protein